MSHKDHGPRARRAWWFAVLPALLATLPTAQGLCSTINDVFQWSPDQIRTVTVSGARAVSANGCPLIPEDGGYMLPVLPVRYCVEPGTRVRSFKVLREAWSPLGSGYTIDDWGTAADLWRYGEWAESLAPSASVGDYASGDWYPSRAVEYAGGGYLRGRRIEGFVVRPVRYRGQGGELEYLSRLEIEVELEGDVDGGLKVSRALRPAEESVEAMLGGLTRREVGGSHLGWMEREGVQVDESAAVEGRFVPSLLPDLEGSAVEYVIVTNEAMRGEFERLAQWKRSKGVSAVVKTTDWIEANYPNGVDLAETIRFFLQDAYANWGTLWVLLGGDTDVIPIRYAWNRSYGEGGEKVPTDVYYSCLDGDWNDDGDDKWGEGSAYSDPGDLADLYPELMVGRAPVNTAAEASLFVDKVIGYEKTPPVGYQNRALLFAEVLFPENWRPGEDIFADGAELAEEVGELLPDGFEVTKLYENYADPKYDGASPLSRDSTVAELNRGYGIAQHVGHGFRTTMSTGSGTLHNPDVMSLANGSKVSVVTALNCDAAAVDYACIGEAFILNPNGGAVAYLGASRFEFPTSSRGFQEEYFKLVFRHGVTRMGEAATWARTIFAPSAHSDNANRWSQFVHVLLGDPELTIWTGAPAELAVSLPSEVSVGASELSVTVTEASGGVPVANATVVCNKEGEVYSVARTGESGLAGLEISPLTQGSLEVTVTARDHVPRQAQVPVAGAQGPHVYAQSISFDDGSGGDGDGIPERGEVFDVRMTLLNDGTAGSSEVSGTLELGDYSDLELLVGSVTAPALAAGASEAAPPFRLRVGSNAPDGRRVACRAIFSTSEGSSTHDFTVQIGVPRLEIYSTTVDDASGGDGDGAAEPGETVGVLIALSNGGRGSGASVYALLRDRRGDAHAAVDSVHYGDIEAGAISPPGRFTVEMGADPAPTFRLSIRDALGAIYETDFNLIPPSPPSGVKGFGDEGSIRILWSPSSEGDLEGYIVYRSGVQGGPYARISPSTVRSSSTYEDRGLEALTRYFYAVAARDSSGNESALSEEVSVSTNPPALPGWPQETDVESPSGVTLGDLDGDGDLEIVAAGGEIYAFHHDGEEVIDGDGEAVTHGVFSSVSGTPSRGFWGTPAVGDADGDGVAEIAANYWDGTATYLWNGSDGAIEPGWPNPSSSFSWPSPSMADIDGDGRWEIVTNGGQGAIFAWHLDGSEVADGDGNPSTVGVLSDYGSDYSYGSTALVDLDGDGADEVITGTRDGRVLAVRADGSSYPGFPYATGRSIVSTPCGADVDGDGDVEIVVAVGSATRPDNSALHVVNVYPSVARQWKVDMLFDRDFNSSPAVGDLDGDGALDIVVGTGDGMIYALRGADGDSLPGWPVSTGARIQGSAAIADIDGDKYPDVLIGDENGLLRCFDRNGEAMPGFPIQVTGAIRSAPVVWDVNDDGLVDILCQAMDRTVYAWTYEGAFDASSVYSPWPMFFHDPRHTSLFTAPMPFPARIASWDLWLEDGGVTMSWSPAGWDGRGTWAVLRKVDEGPEGAAGTADELGGGTGAGPLAGPQAGGLAAAARASGGGEPAFLAGYSEVTGLGLLSIEDGSLLVFRDPASGRGRISYVLELLAEDGTRSYFGPRTIQSRGREPSAAGRLLSVSPNPFTDRVAFLLFIPDGRGASGERVTIRVFDAAGRSVSSRSWRSLGPGVHRMEWDGVGPSGARLGAGVYFFSIEGAGIRKSGKVLLLR